MADANSYPQIPATVWWGVRDILSKTPKATLNENYLAAQLNVQKTAARQYVNELKRIGILSEESKATDLALLWRLDESYEAAVSQIVSSAYGEDLPNLAPTPDERDKAIIWFKTQGLGEGSAKNKAATYFLVSSSSPAEVAPRTQTSSQRQSTKKTAAQKTATAERSAKQPSEDGSTSDRASAAAGGIFPVNLNLQIHISSDASVEQIDAIFASMRKHLGNARIS